MLRLAALAVALVVGCGNSDADAPPEPVKADPAPTEEPTSSAGEALLAAAAACEPSTHTIEHDFELMGLLAKAQTVYRVVSGSPDSCRVERTFQMVSGAPAPSLVEAAATDPESAKRLEQLQAMTAGALPPATKDICEGSSGDLIARFGEELKGVYRSSSDDPLCVPWAPCGPPPKVGPGCEAVSCKDGVWTLECQVEGGVRTCSERAFWKMSSEVGVTMSCDPAGGVVYSFGSGNSVMFGAPAK
jgi:hypothetical protein